MKLKDYYQILGVSQDASTMDIKKAFRQMAMHCHPDRNPQDAEEAGKKFKEINEAYEVLGDGQTRRQYDSLVNLSRSGIVFTGFNRRGKWGCKRRQVWQCRRQQWQE